MCIIGAGPTGPAEPQAKWVADLLTGTATLPPAAEVERWIETDRAALERRSSRSPRHTIQVDFFPYRRLLEAEIAAARRRAEHRTAAS